MVKQMKLKGQIRLNMDRSYTFIGSLYDGSPFECTVDIHDYEQNEEFEAGKYVVDGWLYVIMEAQQTNRCYLTIPKPSIVYGRQILVNELQLMPRVASIADFKPQKQGGKNNLPVGQIVESGTAQAVLSQMIAEEVASKKQNKPKKGSKS